MISITRKWFTEPNGLFVIALPLDWQYVNQVSGYEEKSPFSFQRIGSECAFQVSCYRPSEMDPNKFVISQAFDQNNLQFVKSVLPGDPLHMNLWYATVEGHTVMAKYIFDPLKISTEGLEEDMTQVETMLASFHLLSEPNRPVATEIDKYEKFLASLAASFDLKYKAVQNESYIELVVILANQIDAYLRMALVLKKQLNRRSNRIEISLLYQGENDRAIMERKIYDMALNEKIIDRMTYDKLEHVYKERNKVIHRYIITEFKTRFLYEIVYNLELLCESARKALSKLEKIQAKEKIGIHAEGRKSVEQHSEADIEFIHSQVNDKHHIKEMYRTTRKDDKG